MDRVLIRDGATMLAILPALAVIAVIAFADDLLFAAVGFWWTCALGLVGMIIAIRMGVSRWLLLTAPVLMSPLVVIGMLFYECGRGNCL